MTTHMQALEMAVRFGDERAVRRAALNLSRDELQRAWDDDLLTVHQYETALGLKGWTAAVPA